MKLKFNNRSNILVLDIVTEESRIAFGNDIVTLENSVVTYTILLSSNNNNKFILFFISDLSII